MRRDRWLTFAAGIVLALTLGYVIGVATTHRGSGKPSTSDIGFTQDMSAHEAQAVTLAQLALDRSSTPPVIAIARQILITESTERGTLTGWLTDWGAPQRPRGPVMAWMNTDSMPGMRSNSLLPGLATAAELDRLGRATGQAFDVLFLQLMIRHHVGGIEIATEASKVAHLGEVRTLANKMLADQRQDNAIMLPLLQADGGVVLPLN